MSGVPVKVAAEILGVAEQTVRLWIEQGAPTVKRGAPGQGNGHLVDVDALRLWRGARGAIARHNGTEDNIDFMTIVAEGLWQAFARPLSGADDSVWKCEGVSRSAAKQILAGAYFAIYRARFGCYPDESTLPPAIARLFWR